MAALTSDPAVQAIVLDTASDVLDKASSLIEEAKKAAGHPGDPESQQRLAQVRYWEGSTCALSADPIRKRTLTRAKSHPHGQTFHSALESSLDSVLSLCPGRSVSVRLRRGPS